MRELSAYGHWSVVFAPDSMRSRPLSPPTPTCSANMIPFLPLPFLNPQPLPASQSTIVRVFVCERSMLELLLFVVKRVLCFATLHSPLSMCRLLSCMQQSYWRKLSTIYDQSVVIVSE